jgi:hypothetical protein
MGELLTHLNNNCKEVWSGRVWLDVEGSQYWLGDFEKNQAWYKVRLVVTFHFRPLHSHLFI